MNFGLQDTLVRAENPTQENDLQYAGEQTLAILNAEGRENLTGAHSFYQSKIALNALDLNPLTAAASTLFNMLTTLNHLNKMPDVAQLQTDLINEMKAFEANAARLKYRASIIIAARYAICASFDEIIEQQVLPTEIAWQSYRLLNYFQAESWGGDRFYFILERALEEPEHNIELLEFLYLCLSFGFMGKFRSQSNGLAQTIFIRQQLYDRIREVRGEISSNLLISIDDKLYLPHQAKKPKAFNKKLLWIPIVLLILFAIGFATLYFWVQTQDQALFQLINQISQANAG